MGVMVRERGLALFPPDFFEQLQVFNRQNYLSPVAEAIINTGFRCSVKIEPGFLERKSCSSYGQCYLSHA